MSTRTRNIAAGIAALAALAVGGAAVAGGMGGDREEPLQGDTLRKASAAALTAVGGGRVTDSERDGEKGATYEVEVRKTDGSSVDVRLDASFGVVAIDGDSEQPDDDDGDAE